MGYGRKNSARGGCDLREQLLSIASGSAALDSVCVYVCETEKQGSLASAVLPTCLYLVLHWVSS